MAKTCEEIKGIFDKAVMDNLIALQPEEDRAKLAEDLLMSDIDVEMPYGGDSVSIDDISTRQG